MEIEETCTAAQKILDVVGPVRSAAFEALFYLTIDANLQTFLSGGTTDMPGLEQFERGMEALGSGFDDAIDNHGSEAPLALSSARDHAREALKEFQSCLLDRARHSEEGKAYLAALAHMVQNELRPKISSFVDEIVAFMDQLKSTDMDRHRGVVDEAINDIETINSTINLIAVNASIEAALAGQAGRGFAIIAEEIQGLSQKSKRIVDEIRTSLR